MVWLYQSAAYLIAAYWIFYIQYVKKAHKMLTFTEHGFGDCNMKPRVKVLESVNFYRVIEACVPQLA